MYPEDEPKENLHDVLQHGGYRHKGEGSRCTGTQTVAETVDQDLGSVLESSGDIRPERLTHRPRDGMVDHPGEGVHDEQEEHG